VAARDLAKFNLSRTLVLAPVSGTVTNLSLQPGVYLNAGKPALALVYDQSLRVEGYFEETKLPAIREGDPASVYLMGVSTRSSAMCRASRAGSRTASAPGPTGSWRM
jgi:multidrug resistance efflux pump